MKMPSWAPPDLVDAHEELRPKADAEARRANAGQLRVLDKKADLEKGRLHIGTYFSGHGSQIRILAALVTNNRMEIVWKNLGRRAPSFKYVPTQLFGGKTPTLNLYGACLATENDWINTPKRTKTVSRRLHQNIASQAIELANLLLQVESRDLLDSRAFIKSEALKEFVKALERDDHQIWYGFEGYLDHLLGEMLPPVPGILLELHKRASTHADLPLAISQPNSPNAKLHFFIEAISRYFVKSYGQPLHACVAGVTSAVLDVEVEEDQVRALVRARKSSASRRARNKIRDLRGEITG